MACKSHHARDFLFSQKKHNQKDNQKVKGALCLPVYGNEQQTAEYQNQFKNHGMTEK